LYEGFVAKVLSAGTSPLDLLSMTANKGTTKFFVPTDTIASPSPFNRPRQRSYSSLSADSITLEFNIPPENTHSDYFWISMALNNPLFGAFVIEFEGSAPNIIAVLWILQMTLSPRHARRTVIRQSGQ
jgi:hypothetical protein